MRLAIGALNDFVPGRFTVPGYYGKSGIGSLNDFVPGRFSVPGYYGASGLGRLSAGCGCGSKCGCGPCSSGMGAVDLSPASHGIVDLIGTKLNTTLPAVPNWLIYAGAAAIAYGMYSSSSGARGRRR